MARTPPLVAIVDDDASVRNALERSFRSAGFAVKIYPSGEKFLQSLTQHAPDCVVLDLHMPDVDGFAVQDQLAHAAPHLPVVIITGHETSEARARALAHGARAFLCKPVDEGALLECVSAALGGH